MDSDFNLTALQALQEPMDFLSRAWCNSAIQVYQPVGQDLSVLHRDSTIKAFESDIKAPLPVSRHERNLVSLVQKNKMEKNKEETKNCACLQKMDKSINMDDGDAPPWKTNDLKVIS